jgi:hypothetical protein
MNDRHEPKATMVERVPGRLFVSPPIAPPLDVSRPGNKSGAVTPRDEIVRRAVKLIGTRASRSDIEYSLNVIEVTQANIAFRSKSSKKAAERFYGALRKLRSVGKKLPANLRFALFAEWADERDQFYNGDLNFARAITRLMEASDRYANEPSGKSARNAYKKRLAAEEALWLLRKYDLDIATKKGGVFCTLAALIYGKPRTDLQRHCRAALLSRGAGVGKARGSSFRGAAQR